MTNDRKPTGLQATRMGSTHRASFTLIETLAVTVLLAVLVGTTVVGMPGIAHRERLESALANIGQFDGVARTQALACGQPRMLVFPKDQSLVEIRKPVSDDGPIKWASTARLRFDDQVTVVDLVYDDGPVEDVPTIEQGETPTTDESSHRVVIRGDGQSVTYAVECEIAEGIRGVVVVDGHTGLERIVDVETGNKFDRALLSETSVICD